MHFPDNYLSCFGPRAGQANYFCRLALLTLTPWRSHAHIWKVDERLTRPIPSKRLHSRMLHHLHTHQFSAALTASPSLLLSAL